jgi:ketosteroid isomerase-like protein
MTSIDDRASANVAAVEQGYAAFAAGDVATLQELFDEDIVWCAGGANALAGVYRGSSAVLGFLAALLERVEGNYEQEVQRVIIGASADDPVTVLVHRAAGRDGVSAEADEVHLLSFREGKLIRFVGYATDFSELDALLA